MPVALLAIGIGVAAGAVAVQAIKASIKPPSTADINRGVDLARKLDPQQPREVGVGVFATGGSGLYDTVSGSTHKYAWRVTGLSDWEITGFREIWLDGEKATLSGDPMSGWVDVTSHFTKEDGTPTLRLRIMSGTEGQALEPELAAAAGPNSWGGELTSNDRFAGMAYAVTRQEQVPEEGLTREPGRIVYVCEGAPVHDPSDPASDPEDPATWSRTSDARFNSALICAQAIRGWKRGGEVIVGAHGAVTTDIDDDELEAEAAICDEPKETDAGTEPQYRCGGMIRMEKDGGIRSSLAKVLASMDGDLAELGGSFKIRAGADRVPDHHYDLEAIGGRVVEFDEHGAATQRYNETLADIADPDAAWQMQPLEKYAPAADLAADDNRHRVNSFGLDMVSSRFQGTRIQRSKHKRSRQFATAIFELPLIAQRTEPLDWFTVTDRQTGQTNGVWQAQAVGRINTPDRGCRVIIAAQAIDVTPWSWGQSDADGVTQPGTATYPGGRVPVPVVPTILPTPIYIDGPDTREPAIDVAATFSESPLESTIEFEWRQTANPTYVHSASIEKEAGALTVREGIVPGTEYEFRARLTGGPSRIGDWSDWEAVTANSEYSVPLSNDATLPSAELSTIRDNVNTEIGAAYGTAADALGAAARVAETGGSPSLLNWIEDPRAIGAWQVAIGSKLSTSSGIEVFWNFAAAGVQSDRLLWFPHRKSVSEGVKVQASIDVALSEQTSSVALQAVFFNASNVEIAATPLASGSSGTLSGVVAAPTAADTVQFRLVPTAAAAGTGRMAISSPVSAYAAQDQTVARAYQPPRSETLSRLETIERTLSDMGRRTIGVVTESRRARAAAALTFATTVAMNAAVAQVETNINATLTSTYLSQAAAAATYRTAAQVDQSIADYNTTLQASLAGTYLTQANAATTYRTAAQVDQAIADYQFTIGASTQTIAAHVTANAGAITTINSAAAFYSLEVAAGGGNPAVYSMTAGSGGSSIALAADALYLLNTVGGSTIKALEVVSGNVRVTNDLQVDNALVMSTTGQMRGGQTDYNTGTGFFLGYSGGAHKFSVGNPAGQHITWDNSTLTVKGSLVVDNLAAVSSTTGALTVDGVLTLNASGRVSHAFGASGLLELGALASGRRGINMVNASGAEVFYVDDLGAMRLNGDALPVTRAGTAPATPLPGHRWWDTSVDREYRWNGASWDPWATLGGDWGVNIGGRPANLASLTGSEGILNTAVSIGANGALAGAGGGQVTIGGLGYTGALNATFGADWAASLTNRPTELTDGRISAGLTAAGDVNRAIPTAIADSSNILRRTTGGLFTGALNANYVTNTNELTDGAGLGNSAAWASVSGRPTELTDGRVSSALNASGVLQTNIAATQVTSGQFAAARIPTLDASIIGSGSIADARVPVSAVTQHQASLSVGSGQVTGLGSLATLSTIGDAQVESSRALLQKATSYPSASSARAIELDGKILQDTGAAIRRVTSEEFNGALGSDLFVSSAAYVAVASATLTNINASTLIWLAEVSVAFQTPDAANDASLECQWAIFMTTTSRAAGATVETGVYKPLWEGAANGLTFQDSGSVVLMATNDLVDAEEGFSNGVPTRMTPITAKSAYAGTCYIHLCVRRTTATSTHGVNIAGSASTNIRLGVIG